MIKKLRRRNFLILALGSFIPATVYSAFDMFKVAQKGYYANLMIRLLSWYNEKFHDFTKHFTKVERDYVFLALQSMHQLRWKINDQFSYKKIYWAPQIINGKTNFARLTIGFEPQEMETRKSAMCVVEKHGLSDFAGLEKSEITGLGWDFSKGTFKIYFLSDKNNLDNYLKKIKKLPAMEHLPQKVVASLKFRGKHVIERRLCFPVKDLSQVQKDKILNYENVIHVMGHYSDQRDPYYIPDYMSINIMGFPTQLKNFCEDAMENFATGPTTGVINDTSNMVLYYP